MKEKSILQSVCCEKCGSSDILLLDESRFKCNYCGTITMIEHKKDHVSTIIIKEEKEEKVKPKVAFYHIPNNGNLQDFTREAYIKLFSEDCVSKEIMGAEFGVSRIEKRNYIILDASYDISYSVSIGYDREEKYVDEETYYQNGERRKRFVTKTRIVTDWRPITGNYNTSNTTVAMNDKPVKDIVYEGRYDKDIAYSEQFENFYLKFYKNEMVDIGNGNVGVQPYLPCNEDVSLAKEIGRKKANDSCKSSLPGNRYDDYSNTCKTKINGVSTVVSEEFVLPFSLNGNKYEVTSFAGRIFPLLNFTPRDSEEENIKKKLSKRKKATLWFPVLGFYVFLSILMVIMAIAGQSGGIGDLDALTKAILVVAPFGISIPFTGLFLLFWWIFHKKIWEIIIKDQVKIENRINIDSKVKFLKEKLAQLSLSPLTDEEENAIKTKYEFKQNKFIAFVQKLFLYNKQK